MFTDTIPWRITIRLSEVVTQRGNNCHYINHGKPQGQQYQQHSYLAYSNLAWAIARKCSQAKVEDNPWNTALQPVHYELLRCYNQYLPLKSSWLFSNAKTLGGIWNNSQVPYHWCRTCRLSREAAANKIITEHHRTDSRREKNRLEKIFFFI